MELELQKERFSCYQPCAVLRETHDASAEAIVPDYLPDAARIVDASACLLLHTLEIAGMKAEVGASIQVSVLYLADDGQGVRSISLTLPVEHSFDLRAAGECGDASLAGEVSACEARLLNPRKLSVHAVVELALTPYCRSVLTLTCGVEDAQRHGIELKCEDRELSLITAVRDKSFSFSDELTLSAHEDVRELLRTAVYPRVTECRAMGGKIILKGAACVELLYLTESGALRHEAAQLPFSQLAEGLDDAEPSADAEVRLTSCETALLDDAQTVSVQLGLHAFLTLRTSRTVRCVSDLYSTSCTLNAQLERVTLPETPVCAEVRRNVREQIETGVEPAEVLCASVRFSGAAAAGDQVRAAAAVRVLYLDEAGAPLTAERHVELSAEADTADLKSVALRPLCADEWSVSAAAGGIEVRFPAEFLLTKQVCTTCAVVSELRAEPREPDALPSPSLVLRAVQSGETLWDIAKQYRSTMREIISANELEDEAIGAGQMLLIPRTR